MSDFDGEDGKDDDVKSAFSYLTTGDSGVLGDSAGLMEKIEAQELVFRQLANWVYADFGTNEIKRAQRIKEIQAEGYDEDYARNDTKAPDSITQVQLTAFMQRRQSGEYRLDALPDQDVAAKLSEHYNLSCPQSNVTNDFSDFPLS